MTYLLTIEHHYNCEITWIPGTDIYGLEIPIDAADTQIADALDTSGKDLPFRVRKILRHPSLGVTCLQIQSQMEVLDTVALIKATISDFYDARVDACMTDDDHDLY